MVSFLILKETLWVTIKINLLYLAPSKTGIELSSRFKINAKLYGFKAEKLEKQNVITEFPRSLVTKSTQVFYFERPWEINVIAGKKQEETRQ